MRYYTFAVLYLQFHKGQIKKAYLEAKNLEPGNESSNRGQCRGVKIRGLSDSCIVCPFIFVLPCPAMFRTLPRLARASSFAILETKKCASSKAIASFTFEACGENKIHFVDNVECYLKTEHGLSQDLLEKYWEIEESPTEASFLNRYPGIKDIQLHELLECVEHLDISKGRYKLKGATIVRPETFQYIFATED